MINCFLVGLDLSSDINQLLFVHLNEFEVFLGDVVIVLFHLLERLLVILH